MALGSKEFQEIQAALLDGYGDLFDLRQMVRFGLDDSLDAIAGGRNLTEQIFNLIEWADRKGRVLDLVRSAFEDLTPGVRRKNWKKQAVGGTIDEFRQLRPLLHWCGRARF